MYSKPFQVVPAKIVPLGTMGFKIYAFSQILSIDDTKSEEKQTYARMYAGSAVD